MKFNIIIWLGLNTRTSNIFSLFSSLWPLWFKTGVSQFYCTLYFMKSVIRVGFSHVRRPLVTRQAVVMTNLWNVLQMPVSCSNVRVFDAVTHPSCLLLFVFVMYWQSHWWVIHLFIGGRGRSTWHAKRADGKFSAMNFDCCFLNERLYWLVTAVSTSCATAAVRPVRH